MLSILVKDNYLIMVEGIPDIYQMLILIKFYGNLNC